MRCVLKLLFVLLGLIWIARPVEAAELSACQKFRAEQSEAFKSAILQAVSKIDKKSRCMATRDALVFLDKMVAPSETCPAAPDHETKEMVSRRKATYTRHCGA
ncbi:MAG: hypothetical protein AB7K04_04320 [Pseudorhodoplanes sp.]